MDLVNQSVPCPGGARALIAADGTRVTDLQSIVKNANYVAVGRERKVSITHIQQLMAEPDRIRGRGVMMKCHTSSTSNRRY